MKTLENCNGTLLRVLMVFYGLVPFISCNGTNGVDSARLIGTKPSPCEVWYFEPELELYFDKPVTAVRVNDVEAQPNGSLPTRDWQINLRQFDTIWISESRPPEQVCFTVSYTDETGIHEQDWCSWQPEIIVEAPVLEIIEGSVEDGDKGVNPAPLNTNGITFRFSENVEGTIEIRTEGGTPLGWIARWNRGDNWGDSVTIIPPPGQELVKGTVYIIEHKVIDAKGDSLFDKITFTTKE